RRRGALSPRPRPLAPGRVRPWNRPRKARDGRHDPSPGAECGTRAITSQRRRPPETHARPPPPGRTRNFGKGPKDCWISALTYWGISTAVEPLSEASMEQGKPD